MINKATAPNAHNLAKVLLRIVAPKLQLRNFAEAGVSVARYQAKGQKHHYWYYQLRASHAIFPKTNSNNEYSRFQHLGKAGSQSHIDGVLAVIRRSQIDELTKAIDGLNESWSDLYSNEEKVGHRVE